MQIVKDIYVPLDAEGPFEHIKAQQNSADSLRVRICLLVNNQLFTLPTGIIPQIVYSKPDGHLVVNDCAVDGNYIIVDYTKQMLIAAGTAKAKLYFTDAGTEVYSASFYTDIYPSPDGVLEESESEYNTINKYIVEATEKALAAEQAASNAQASAAGAEYYFNQTKTIMESLSGALRPMGTKAFEDLPSVEDAVEGDMYNISNEFTTTSDFKEGAGHVIPMGANIYKTTDGFWDVLAGTLVTGVKGNKETVYRVGNINITPANIGAATEEQYSELNSNLNTKISGIRGSYYTRLTDLANVDTEWTAPKNGILRVASRPNVAGATVAIKSIDSFANHFIYAHVFLGTTDYSEIADVHVFEGQKVLISSKNLHTLSVSFIDFI